MLQLELIFHNDALTVEVDLAKKFIKGVWLRQPTSKEFRKYISLVTEYALAQNITLALYDIRQRSYMEYCDQNWTLKEIFPLFEDKFKKLAYLTSLESLDLMDTLRLQEAQYTAKYPNKTFQIEHFLEEEKALEWLFE
ncbi:hypothetical protein [Pontibacter arcticus]|uniref:SpoIIAA-like n=1 Tax=Pontibacter arcticus TaxID=2080288 RepID=A0A364RE76_9BACT|nr:hypothetical protein [Pontibacter arcticus]RAU82621.1 hypothetical protein DP923_12730 [Pontibacter arcticus]